MYIILDMIKIDNFSYLYAESLSTLICTTATCPSLDEEMPRVKK